VAAGRGAQEQACGGAEASVVDGGAAGAVEADDSLSEGRLRVAGTHGRLDAQPPLPQPPEAVEFDLSADRSMTPRLRFA